MKRLPAGLKSCWALVFLLAAVLPLGLPHPVQAQDQIVHVVQQGENLFRLALRYGTTVEAIIAENGLPNEDTIYAGQRLLIPSTTQQRASVPAAATTGGTYVVQPGDTIVGIAFRYGVQPWELMSANGIWASYGIFPGQGIVIPAAGGAVPDTLPETSEVYIVRGGDTLTQIATRFHTTPFALAQSNGLADPSAIREGQVLKVPLLPSAPGASPGGPKQIQISLSEQHLYAFEGQSLVYSFVCSSGRAPYYTRTGEFQVQSKIANAYGGAWDIWMPHWLGIYWAGSSENGIHALPIMADGQTLWEGYLGSPISYGCIVLATDDAETLYHWAEIGTPVLIRG